MVLGLSVEPGGPHAVQDNRNTAARCDGTCLLRSGTNHSSSTGNYPNLVAATKLPTVTDVPLYFKAVSVILPPGEKSGVSRLPTASSTKSQDQPRSRSVARPKRSAPERGCSSGGKAAVLKAGSGGPSTFLHFFLVSAADLDRPAETAPAAVKELYRTAAPIPDLKPGGYDLNLTRVTFPAQMPSNPPHHRSGAALYYIISGTGANTVERRYSGKGTGFFDL